MMSSPIKLPSTRLEMPAISLSPCLAGGKMPAFAPPSFNGTAPDSSSVPRLPNPLLITAGGLPRGDKHFRKGIAELCQGGNNEYGGIPIHLHELAKFKAHYHEQPNQNIFFLNSSKFGTVEENAAEMKKAIEFILGLTGAKKVDVVAECLKGLAARKYAVDGGDKIDHLFHLGTEHQGFRVIGEAICTVGKVKAFLQSFFNWELPVKSIGRYSTDPETIKVLQDIRTNLGNNNPILHELNTPTNIAKELGNIGSIVVIAETGRHFLAGKLGGPLGNGIPFSPLDGDGIVDLSSANFKYSKRFFIQAKKEPLKPCRKKFSEREKILDHHKQLKAYKAVWAIIAHELTGKAIPEDPKVQVKVKPPALFKEPKENTFLDTLDWLEEKAGSVPLALLCIAAGYTIASVIVALGISHAVSGGRWPKNKNCFSLIEYGKDSKVTKEKSDAAH